MLMFVCNYFNVLRELIVSMKSYLHEMIYMCILDVSINGLLTYKFIISVKPRFIAFYYGHIVNKLTSNDSDSHMCGEN